MPKIRKETSNRKSTNDRAKRRKQVKESKRKTAKAAKKNPQWKSKTPKDPGIPSEFPYKDQILAEVAEARRIATEEKEKKKEEKQRNLARARAIARGELVEEEDAEEDAEDSGDDEELAEVDENTGKPISKKDLNVGAESIAALSAKLVGTKLKPRPKPASEVVEEEEEDEDEVPVLINRDLPNLKSVLDKADVVVELLDGRDPMAFRSKHVEELVQDMGKKILFVVNKIDTCPREALAQWSTKLRSYHPTLLFRSASFFLPEKPILVDPKIVKKGSKGKTPKIPMNNAVGADSVLACLAHWAKEKQGEEPLAVAVVGVTNVGKSSFINSLLQRAALPVYTLASSSRGPTTTELPQEVILEVEDQKITVIDTPGLSFLNNAEEEGSISEERRARDILLRSKGRIDRLKDPNPPIGQIVSRSNAEDLMLLYSLPAFLKGDSAAFLSGVARANQLIKKKGEPDLTGAARIVLRDWSVGKLAHYTTPSATPPTTTPESSEAKSDTFLTQLYAKDETILASLPTRKEKRKEGGLVKLSPYPADERKAAIETDWAGLEASEDEESDDDGPEDLGAEGMDVDDEEEEDEEEEGTQADEDEDEEQDEAEDEEEQEVVPPPLSNKQKRKRPVEVAVERPSKKVAFAAASSSKSKRSGSKVAAASPAKPLKPVQSPSKKLDAKAQEKPVSALKTAAKARSTPTKVAVATGAAKKLSENNGKVANKPSTRTAAPKKDGNTAEVYDFGKFF